MGMGFENCEVGFGKKKSWEMGLVPPLQNPPISGGASEKGESNIGGEGFLCTQPSKDLEWNLMILGKQDGGKVDWSKGKEHREGSLNIY